MEWVFHCFFSWGNKNGTELAQGTKAATARVGYLNFNQAKERQSFTPDET